MELRNEEPHQANSAQVTPGVEVVSETGMSVPELLAIIERDVANRWPRMITRGILAYVTLVLIWESILLAMGHPGWMSVSISFLMWLSLIFGFMGWSTRRQKAALMALARVDDLRAVGPLLDGLYIMSASFGRVTTTALARLLPRLRPEDKHLLTDWQRSILYQLLPVIPGRYRHDTLFYVGLLQALIKVGVPEDKIDHTFARVQALAMGKGLAAKNEAVRQAAIECLEALKERTPGKAASDNLVRAAEPPVSETLLHPAGGPPVAEVKDLVRPALREQTARGHEPEQP